MITGKKVEESEDLLFESVQSPLGSSIQGRTKYEETDSILKEAVLALIRKDRNIAWWGSLRPKGPLYLTVHNAWSGYSEYTITSQWDEITVEWDDYTRHFEGMAEFFKALAEAEHRY